MFSSAVNRVVPANRKEEELESNKIDTLGVTTNVIEKMPTMREGKLQKYKKWHCTVMSTEPIEKM